MKQHFGVNPRPSFVLGMLATLAAAQADPVSYEKSFTCTAIATLTGTQVQRLIQYEVFSNPPDGKIRVESLSFESTLDPE